MTAPLPIRAPKDGDSAADPYVVAHLDALDRVSLLAIGMLESEMRDSVGGKDFLHHDVVAIRTPGRLRALPMPELAPSQCRGVSGEGHARYLRWVRSIRRSPATPAA
jgi:hypothetical protein